MAAVSLVLSIAALLLSVLAFRNSRRARKTLHPLLTPPKVTHLPEKTEWDD